MGLFSKLFKKKSKVSEKAEKSTEAVKQPEVEAVKTGDTEKEIADTSAAQEKATVAPDTENVSLNDEKKEFAKKQSGAKKVKTQSTAKTSDKTESSSKTEEQKEEITEEVAPQADKNAFTGKFEINRSKDGKKFFFNLFASNKVGIATSQMYSSAQSALTGVKSVIVNAPKAPIEDQTLKTFETLPNPKWEIYLDNGNKYRFRLNATNGSCVCHSQGYTTKTACKNGIDSIIRSSKNAQIIKTYLAKDE